MAEQLKLFEDLPILNQNINKPKEPTEDQQSQKQLEKYATQKNYGGKLWNAFVGDDKTADAQRKKIIQSTIKSPLNKVESHPKQKQPYHIYNPVTQNLDNVNDPNYLKPKPRVETMEERIDRLRYELDGNDEKPAHYDDPNIVDYENFKRPPREFKNDDKSTYMSNRSQKQKLNTWELMVETANTPEEKKEVREILRDDYKKNKGKHMSSKELRMINKHPEQIKAQVEALSIIPNKILNPIVTPTPAIKEPSIPLELKIKQMADDRLRRQQQDYDRRYGTGGIVILRRPN